MVAKRTTPPPATEPASESVRALREATTRFTEAQAALDRRLDASGLGGMEGMQALLARVGQILAPVDGDELARARTELDGGIARLEAIRADLATLADLKRRVPV
jgi:hypothetical protein